VTEIVTVLKSLAEENRFRIVMMLRERPLCVCEICAALDVTVSTVSSHLKLLARSAVVTREKDGRWVIYRLSDDTAVNAIVELAALQTAHDPTLARDREHVRRTDRESCAVRMRNT